MCYELCVYQGQCVTNSVYIRATNSVHLRQSTKLPHQLPPICSDSFSRPKRCVTNSVYIWATNSVHLRHSTELTNKLPPILSNWIPRPKYVWRTLCIFNSQTVYIWDKARSCRSNCCDHPFYWFFLKRNVCHELCISEPRRYGGRDSRWCCINTNINTNININ